MSATDLDDLLASMAEPLPAAAENEARQLAEETMPRRLKRGRAPRRSWALPLLVGGALAPGSAASSRGPLTPISRTGRCAFARGIKRPVRVPHHQE